MPNFDKSAFPYNYRPQAQINALRGWEQNEPGRALPNKANNQLLVATWDIAILVSQDRRPRDLQILAGLRSWFALVAGAT